jgi:uncharacterized membrane protein
LRRGLQFTLCFFGVTVIVVALIHVVFGPTIAPGSVPVNATLDSQDRFYGTVFGGSGVGLLWCVRDVENKGIFVRFLALTIFAGGLARLVSMAVMGMPHAFIVGLTLLELFVPPALVLAQRRVSRAANARPPSPAPPVKVGGTVPFTHP